MPDTAIITDPLPASTPSQPEGEYLTRRQAADYIRDVLGRPMSFSTASKLAALGEFAQPALCWGRRPLCRPADLRGWAEARSRRAVPDEAPGAQPR